MVHHGYVSDLRLGSTKAFIILALVSGAIYGPRAVAALPGTAAATDTTAQEFGGALARTHLVQMRCPNAAHGVECYELV